MDRLQTTVQRFTESQLASLVLFVAVCIIYLPAVGHGFIKDDFSWIGHSPASVHDLFFTAPSGFYRPMVSLSFLVNRWAFGHDAFGYGVTNFLLLVACAVGVFALARAMSIPRGAAVVASSVWAFNWNAINMAVLWISGRTALLLVLFATLGATAFFKRRWWLAASLMLAAMFCKEEAVLLPVTLLAWFVADRMSDRVRWRASALTFAAASLIAECLYFLLRTRSGALTPATAPSYYRFTFAPDAVLLNALHYLDRSATFALVVTLGFLALSRRWSPLGRTVGRNAVFGLFWFVGGLAITVFIPARSSLYACLPSVGIALAAATVIGAQWRGLPRAAQRRTVAIGLVVPFILLPLYMARNGRLVREAELSSYTLARLQTVAKAHGNGAVVVLKDDITQKPSLTAAFGSTIQEAADLVVTPRITVWIDSPDAALAPLRRNQRADVTLSLKNGVLAQSP